MEKEEKTLEYYFNLFKIGDEKAFEFIFKHYYAKMVKYAMFNLNINLFGELEDSEDIVIETFTKVWNTRKRFETWIHLKNSLYISVRNACISFIRNRKVKDDTLKYTPLLDDHSEIISFIEEERDLEAIILSKLHFFTKQQQTILLLTIKGKEEIEIAKELNCTTNVVYVHRSRMRKKLHKFLQPYF